LHGTIVEPFAGAAGYSTRYASRNVVLCDVDPIVVGMWRYLIRATAEELLALPDLPLGASVDDLALCQEARWLIGFWLNKGGSRPCKTPSAWMRSGLRPNSYWGAEVRSLLAGQIDAIRHWRVNLCDWREAPLVRATWFVDPPYQGAGRLYRFGASAIDYAALGGWCRRLPGQVIVCENEGASWLPFATTDKAISSVGRRSGCTRRSFEAVWLGGA
jgi:hypothetical protein